MKVDARMDLPQREADALAEQEEKHRAEQGGVDAEERRKARHARRALHGALVSVRTVHRELAVLAFDPEQADAKVLADQLATAIVDAEVTESSGTVADVEATTAKLLQLLQN